MLELLVSVADVVAVVVVLGVRMVEVVRSALILMVQKWVGVPWTSLDVACEGFFAPTLPLTFPCSLRRCLLLPMPLLAKMLYLAVSFCPSPYHYRDLVNPDWTYLVMCPCSGELCLRHRHWAVNLVLQPLLLPVAVF